MISDEDLFDLPEDPDLAFVEYDRKLREGLHGELEASEGHSAETLYLEYINHVTAAAKALDLDILRDWNVPSTHSDIWDAYQQFRHDVDHYTVQITLRHARRVKEYSVGLDPVTRRKLRHHLTQIKEVVDNLDVSDRKKEALYSKINALEDEIDRNRTRFDAVMDLVLTTADTGGEAARKLEPARKIIESITGLLAKAKHDEDESKPSLPAPRKPRRLEPPRKKLPDLGKLSDLDDEIPF